MENLISNTSQPKRHFNKMLLLILFGITSTITQNVLAQTPYKTFTSSEIKVDGTSNLHDWSMLASDFTCTGNLLIKNGNLINITALKFSLPVNNLKSKEDLMDSRAYKALKAKAFPKITFVLTEATVIAKQKSIKAIGNLTISGVSKKVEINSTYVLNADESVTMRATEAIKMSDYGVKAPSFMLGALRTGDDLSISILLKLKSAELQTKN